MANTSQRVALDIHVTGIVQGVGFRPFVYCLAQEKNISGWVLNGTDGVHIHAEGEEGSLGSFVMEISEHAPQAARVEKIHLDDAEDEGHTSFEIRFSEDEDQVETTLISPDLATCDECLRELFDPSDRRYRYPFINCTNCGPRFTIIEGLPYDRANTSMKKFPMCTACEHEYTDPADRRFHAQPDACWDCGPLISWKTQDEGPIWGDTREASDAILARAVQVLRNGGILAVKGLGGFHLVCDANNAGALAELRRRKHRWGKGFAVMVKDPDDVRQDCYVSKDEEDLLKGPARPIVLLRKRPGASFAPGLADGLCELGVMLPATPLQHLLLHDFDGMLVMTSGNVHGEPIQIDDQEAYSALAGIADAFIGNDRPIKSRYDDSVVRVLRFGPDMTATQVIRRARGLAPVPIKSNVLRDIPSQIFATGPEQKVTFCLTRPGEAFVSQHIGDMENTATNDAWFEAKRTYESLLRLRPDVIACDEHPEYLTSKWASNQDLRIVPVQHHHAHIAAVMAENDLESAVCGFAFDGTGYGEDGAIWGGEVMLANLQTYERFANFAYFPLPGGAMAIKHPLRCAYGALWAFDLLDHPGARHLHDALGETTQTLDAMIERGINCPQTSSVGRLFDAASALLGICDTPTYEGEGAILLEAAISDDHSATDEGSYHIDILKNSATDDSTARDTSVLLADAAPLFKAVLDDVVAGVDTGVIARRFHDAFVEAIVTLARLSEALYGLKTVALSGGVFMNRYLVEHAVAALSDAGYTVALPRELPSNDGSISFGQAVVACHTDEHN